MYLRHLVPALGAVALTGSLLSAADAGPTVTFDGWADNILQIGTTSFDSDPTGTTKKDEKGLAIGFSAEAALKATWKVTDKLTAHSSLWISPGLSPTTGSDLALRESYVSWQFSDVVGLKMGKYIDHIGWIAADPTGLFTINSSLIGYQHIYGNDVIGGALIFGKKDVPITGELHITNGYFDAADAGSRGGHDAFSGNAAGSPNRENHDLGFGLDLTYTFAKGNVNLEFAYDPHGGGNGGLPFYMVGGGSAGPLAGAGDLGGNAFYAGLNATLTPVDGWLFGAEVQYFTISDFTLAAGGSSPDSGMKRTQGLLLANYTIPKASVPYPMAITGMIQYETSKQTFTGAGSPKALEVAVALMTNPLGSTNFGFNYELAYTSFDSDVTGADKVNNVTFSLEAIAVY